MENLYLNIRLTTIRDDFRWRIKIPLIKWCAMGRKYSAPCVWFSKLVARPKHHKEFLLASDCNTLLQCEDPLQTYQQSVQFHNKIVLFLIWHLHPDKDVQVQRRMDINFQNTTISNSSLSYPTFSIPCTRHHIIYLSTCLNTNMCSNAYLSSKDYGGPLTILP